MSLGRIDSMGLDPHRHSTEQIHHPKMGDCRRGRCWKWDWKVQKDADFNVSRMGLFRYSFPRISQAAKFSASGTGFSMGFLIFSPPVFHE
jgi:hypothetical protein